MTFNNAQQILFCDDNTQVSMDNKVQVTTIHPCYEYKSAYVKKFIILLLYNIPMVVIKNIKKF